FPLFVLLASRRYSLVWNLAAAGLGLGAAMLYATSSRATWLAAAATLLTLAVWPWLARRRARFNALFWLTAVAVLVGTWLYTVAPSYEQGMRLQDLAAELTGKDFFSGRQRFWGALVEAIAARPLF